MVVSNTSPIANLAVIGHVELLGHLYGRVLVPEAVREELAATESVAKAVGELDWIESRPVGDHRLVESLTMQLHVGEAEAIVLALERRPDFLLMDERRGRRIAASLGLKTIGLLAAILEARSKGLIPAVRPLLDALLAQAGFWIAPHLHARVLAAAREA